jgi:hypothetical protein
MYVRIHLLSEFHSSRVTVKFRFFCQYWRTETVDLCDLDRIDARVLGTIQVALEGPGTVVGSGIGQNRPSRSKPSVCSNWAGSKIGLPGQNRRLDPIGLGVKSAFQVKTVGLS